MAIALLVMIFGACQFKSRDAERAFYYWKNEPYTMSQGELERIKDLKVQKLYIKFFEVESGAIYGARPYAKTSLHVWGAYGDYVDGEFRNDSVMQEIMLKMHIVPTVFIRNEVFKNISESGLDSLADNMNFLINKYYKRNIHDAIRSPTEIQVDCDWTESTKDSYFQFLKKFKQVSGKDISCTLRLYPYKYPDKMGVPPVERAMLMCYNLVSPFAKENMNSVQNNEELEKYLKGAEKYPVHLDIALPTFSWLLVYQNGQFAGMIKEGLDKVMGALKELSPMWYEVQYDVEVGDMYLRAGDKVKLEQVTEKDTHITIELLKKYLPMDATTTVSLFHLDEKSLEKYSDETLGGFYSAFGN